MSTKEVITIILAVMVFYDLHLHVIECFFGNQSKSMSKKYYWPPAKIFKNETDKFYNIFWTTYWTIAFVLLLYLIFV
ncbi:hypothetical protein ACFL3C_00660 [Patescibacteria group bacterium]